MRLLATLRLRYFQRAIRRGGRDGETRRRGDGGRGRGGERERGRKSTILILTNSMLSQLRLKGFEI